jgi:hypothetical protein
MAMRSWGQREDGPKRHAHPLRTAGSVAVFLGKDSSR